MQNKGAINLFAILLGLACIFLFVFYVGVTRGVEADAKAYASSYAQMAACKTSSKGFCSRRCKQKKKLTWIQ
jgi:hypothetical protein